MYDDLMNQTIFRVLIGGTYGVSFGWLGREFGLGMWEMFALLCLSIAWLIVFTTYDSNCVRSTPTDRLEDDRNA